MKSSNIFGRAKEKNLYRNLPKNRSIYSEKDIDYVMELTARASLQYMAEMTAELLYDYTVTDFYDRRNPTHYTRTFELLDSITVSAQNDGISEVFFDTEKIHGHFQPKGMWNQHRSMPYGDVPSRNVRDYIPEMAEEGNLGGMYEYEGGHMMESTLNDIQEIFGSLKSDLNRSGISLSI